MHTVMYQLIAMLFCVCWTLVNASPPVAINFVSNLTAVSSRQNDGNRLFKIFDKLQPSTSKSNFTMRSGRNSCGGLVVNNEHANNFSKNIKLSAKISSAEFDDDTFEESMVFTENEVSIEIIRFYNDVLYTLTRHLLDCLQVEYSNETTIAMLSQFIELIQIDQNLLNNSIALLVQNRVDVTRLIKLYLFFCGPFQEPAGLKNDLNFHGYGQRIHYIQNDMIEKFKDILGDESIISIDNILNVLPVSGLQESKKKTEHILYVLATSVLNEIKPYSQSLPSTPIHFICIEFLKWTTLMASDNEDAVEIQNTRIIVENTYTTLRQYAEGLRYEIDINKLIQLNYEVLLHINKTFLRYMYKHFFLTADLIDINILTLKAFNLNIMSLVLEQICGFRVFLDVFSLYFVAYYSEYIARPRSLSILMSLIYYTDRFKQDLHMDLVPAVQELHTEPEIIVNIIKVILNVFTMVFLEELQVNDREKWIDDVNEEIISGASGNISTALERNKNKALAIMYLCINQLNPYWPHPNKM